MTVRLQHAVLLSALTFVGCTDSSSQQKKKTGGSSNVVPTSPTTPVDNSVTPTAITETITISCANCTSSVKWNVTSNWQFTATTSSGKTATITSITADRELKEFSVAGGDIKFTPRKVKKEGASEKKRELSGTLTVVATVDSISATQLFEWGKTTSGGTPGSPDTGSSITPMGPAVISILNNTIGGIGSDSDPFDPGDSEDDEEYEEE